MDDEMKENNGCLGAGEKEMRENPFLNRICLLFLANLKICHKFPRLPSQSPGFV